MATIEGWIRIGPFADVTEFICERCGIKRPVHIPCSIGDFLKQSEAFNESHKFCQKVRGKKVSPRAKTAAKGEIKQ